MFDTPLPISGIKYSGLTAEPQSLSLNPSPSLNPSLRVQISPSKQTLSAIEVQENSLQIKPEDKKGSFFMTQIVAPFDVINRWKRITVSNRTDALSCAFDLIRVLSMGYMTLNHQQGLSISMSDPLMDPYIPRMQQASWNISIIQDGSYCVDLFLFMGGFVAIISIKRLTTDFKKSRKWKLPVLYIFILIKRYVRIFPMLAMITIFMVYVLPYTTGR
jgi:hypothetical protein